ncbi:MAG: hypothetical protein ACK5IQ_04315 [Bacteroidales bacterium]
MPYALGYKRTADKRSSLRGAGDVAISTYKEQIATLPLAMTGKCRYYDITML